MADFANAKAFVTAKAKKSFRDEDGMIHSFEVQIHGLRGNCDAAPLEDAARVALTSCLDTVEDQINDCLGVTA